MILHNRSHATSHYQSAASLPQHEAEPQEAAWRLPTFKQASKRPKDRAPSDLDRGQSQSSISKSLKFPLNLITFYKILYPKLILHNRSHATSHYQSAASLPQHETESLEAAWRPPTFKQASKRPKDRPPSDLDRGQSQWQWLRWITTLQLTDSAQCCYW